MTGEPMQTTFKTLCTPKMDGTQRRLLGTVSQWRMHCIYCSMPKDTALAEQTVKKKKIKPIASSYASLKASVRQAVKLVHQSVKNTI